MENKILTLLGFASKAGKLSFGFSATKDAVIQKKSKLIAVCSDISEKSKKEVRFLAEKYGVKYIIFDTVDQMTVSDAVGRGCGVLSVNDIPFAEGILKNIGGNANDK